MTNNNLFDQWKREYKKKFEFKKNLGQNFLQNPFTGNQIVSLIDGEKNIVEIGPGSGILTQEIISLSSPITIKLIEYDKDICFFLEKNIKDDRVSIFNNDALLFNDFFPDSTIIGNLPYNISKKLIVNWCSNMNIKKIVAMFQKEVGDLILSKKGKNHNHISIFIQTYFNIKRAFNLNPSSFFPTPSVFSSVLVFERSNTYQTENINPKDYMKVLKKIFQFRRKKLINIIGENVLKDENIDKNKRAEDLTIIDCINIYKKLLKI